MAGGPGRGEGVGRCKAAGPLCVVRRCADRSRWSL